MPRIETWLTKATGIRVPIIQGGMMWVGRAELTAAVANAGALGFITAFTQPSPEALRKEIQRAKKLTNQPFGVNITLLPSIKSPDYKAYAQAALDEGIKIFETAGNPEPVLQLLKDNNAIIIHKCISIKHALRAEKLGVSAISIDGFECAGHPGEEDMTSLVLLAKAARTLKIPYIASGGFADARGCAAALTLGASGVNMGTRFLCTVESPIHQKVKEQITQAKETDTQLILRAFRNTSRVYKNKVSVEAARIEREKQDVKFEDVRELVAGARGSSVYATGDVEAGVWSVGQVQGIIDDIPTCKDLVKKLETGIIEILTETPKLVIREDSKL